jgi:hypothetical protein
MGYRASNVHRVRKDIEKDIFLPLSDAYFRWSYRMKKESFYNLHSILQESLENHFFPKKGGKRWIYKNSYLIRTEIRLSIALHFFAGGCPYDLMVSHGVGYSSVFASVWGVVDAVNNCPDLSINFPSVNEQLTISRGFKAMSGAGFDKVIGAIDGILIWTHKPSRKECVETVCGEKSFLCHRKDKFGMNMQAICDDKLRFIWIDLSWPGCTADYMAWVTSEL